MGQSLLAARLAEETLIGVCGSKLQVQPKRAALVLSQEESPTATYTGAATWLGGLIEAWALAAIAIDLLQIRVDNVDNEQNGLNFYPPKCVSK